MSQAPVQAIHRIVPKEECTCSLPALDVYAVMSTHVLFFQTPAAASCFPSSSFGHANWQHVLCRPDRHCCPLGYEIVIYILSGRACAPVYHRVLKMGDPIDEQIAGKSRIRRRKGNQQVSNKSSQVSLKLALAGLASRTSQGQTTLIQGLLNCFGAACH